MTVFEMVIRRCYQSTESSACAGTWSTDAHSTTLPVLVTVRACPGMLT